MPQNNYYKLKKYSYYCLIFFNVLLLYWCLRPTTLIQAAEINSSAPISFNNVPLAGVVTVKDQIAPLWSGTINQESQSDAPFFLANRLTTYKQ